MGVNAVSNGRNDVYIYAGVTRWGGGGSQAAQADTLGGVFRLKLGETSWTHSMAGFPDVVHVHCVVAHPENPETLFAGTHEAVYRSQDRGQTWKQMNMNSAPRQIWAIAFDPSDSRHMFAGASPIGVYESKNGGSTWNEVPSGAIPDHIAMGNFKNRVMRIAVNPADPKKVVAAMEVNGCMASEDGGATWVDRNADLLRLAQEPNLKSQILTTSDNEGMLDAHAIGVAQDGSGTVFLANRMGIFESKDNCRTWRDLEVKRFSNFTYGRDIRPSLCEPGVLYAALSVSSRGETGSIARSPDMGKTWARFDHGVTPTATVMSVAPHPTLPEIVFFCSRHGEVYGTADAGKSWQSYPLPPGCNGAYAVTCA